jgi:hypothetical protein
MIGLTPILNLKPNSKLDSKLLSFGAFVYWLLNHQVGMLQSTIDLETLYSQYLKTMLVETELYESIGLLTPIDFMFAVELFDGFQLQWINEKIYLKCSD